ncbi:hypothetical protein KR222_000867 [Zaprionus bogoriensis]|nr:hypothetical protein KR222_000867 [Zaprionus bogoriensis]
MPSQAPSSVTLNFKIKLLSGENVVLVDCLGFESELFMPQIVKGRITFQNIIPNHRCCDAAAANVQTDQLILPVSKLGDVRVIAGAGTPQRVSCEPYVVNLSGPLARSTPSTVKSIARADKENIAQLPTPEQTRCRPLPKAVTPQAVALLQLDTSSASHTQVQELPGLSLSDSISMNSPLMPSSSSSLPLSEKSTDSAQCGFMHKAPPARTYARRKPNATSPPKPPISWSPLKKKKKSSKVSSTKPPSPSMKLEVRHRKLIVDNKKTLASHELHKVPSKPVTKSKIQRKQVTAKSRAQFHALKGTAFDQLTTPSHANISSVLAKQFQDACVEKYSETLPNYAELSETEPLQMDRQVRSLIAKEKRLEKQMTKAQKASLVKRNKP